MKKIIFGLLIFTLFINCKREYDNDPGASIVGVWKPISAKATKVIAGFPVSQTENMSECQQNARMNYKADASANETRYDMVNNNCEKTLDRTFTYSYNPTTKSLVHTFADGTVKNAEVLSLTQSQLIVKAVKNINGEDYDVEVTNQRQ